MISNDLNDMLSLLAITIFADKRVFAKEIETFVVLAKKLQSLRQTKTHLSEAKLLAWFDSNSGNIREKMATPQFEPWLYSHLDRLESIEDKNLILNIMREISESDGEFHVSEKALLVLIRNYWKMEPLDVAV